MSDKPTAHLENYGPLVDERVRKKQRIPPGQFLAKKWPVLSVEREIPPFDGKHWDITIEFQSSYSGISFFYPL